MLLLLIGLYSVPVSNAVVNCRTACRRCREAADYPDMLEVYCAMCSECKERRREWLQGAPGLKLRGGDDNRLQDSAKSDTVPDDCITTQVDSCEDQAMPLVKKETTTTTTTTTTTRPRTPKPHCITHSPKPQVMPRAPCMTMPCAIPVAPLAMCPMCPPVYNTLPIITADQTLMNAEQSTASVKSPGYFYLGVPKKMLKDLQLLRS